MRLVVMGQQAFGKDVLQTLIDTNIDEIVAVYCEPDREGAPIDPIKELATDHGIPVHQPAHFNSQDTLDEPLYRGPSAVNWPIIMGSTTSGYSWFYPTDGLDEGDVLLQWSCSIEADDTVINLYFKKIYPSAVESVLQVCDLFRDGNPPRIQQDESLATYQRRCTKKHAHIDWYKPIDQVYNLIRGTNPAPGAWTLHNGSELNIYDATKVSGDGVAGRIMELSEAGVSVQCVGGRVLVKRVKPAGGKKISASEWAADVGLSTGDQLG